MPEFERNCWVSVVAPTDQEVRQLIDEHEIPDDFVTYPLDIDEKARIEKDENAFFLLMRVPHFVGIKEEIPFTTIPVGLIILKDCVISICKEENVIIEEFEHGRSKDSNPGKKFRFVLKLLHKAAGKFLTHLREINKIVDGLEDNLQARMRNKELMELLKFQKILVFYTTALKSNELMMERLQRSGTFQAHSDDSDLMEDVIVEFQQAIEMTNISNNILTQMMGAYASIINNNMNIVIKFLTIITITLAIPTLIASIYGMNVPLPGQNNPGSFATIIVACLLFSSGVIYYFYRRRWF